MGTIRAPQDGLTLPEKAHVLDDLTVKRSP